MGSQRVWHNWVTELTELNSKKANCTWSLTIPLILFYIHPLKPCMVMKVRYWATASKWASLILWTHYICIFITMFFFPADGRKAYCSKIISVLWEVFNRWKQSISRKKWLFLTHVKVIYGLEKVLYLIYISKKFDEPGTVSVLNEKTEVQRG